MEGPSDRVLYVGHSWISWSIWSSLKKEKVYIDSGSAGHPCPGHPRNATNLNLREGIKEWKFNKAKNNAPNDNGDDLEEGGVFVRCSVHI